MNRYSTFVNVINSTILHAAIDTNYGYTSNRQIQTKDFMCLHFNTFKCPKSVKPTCFAVLHNKFLISQEVMIKIGNR